ncbi:tetraacyldisaccharide 4'-kinase [Bosea sp. (in: a-proteobacteria)]|uniref:tetraacyldisaccharide 4'-kinase n=1 Tax=Bosea sp. (in: a-proteobacteria) TaxID=1871050 RepID=UPI0026220A4C|nr:tetraacyldisaccharide 4'-kinase [Bosea sp. (in: a-proteobacteria)]MCO5092312.1 tetraacyldisaccharide 4'-kinase [Bosea sp. (in: a-proteobacteria)]
MRLSAPRFWWRDKPGLLARLLQPLGFVYGRITARRMRQPGIEAGLPVICIGNFVAGGAGKTPTAIAVVRLLAERGEKPFVLMRGYGGRLSGPVEVDPDRHRAADVGDEPLLMARHARTVIARDRAAGARLARGLGASLVVMDDGLQNPALTRHLKLAVVDGASGAGNGLCLPAGPLRAPLAMQMDEADAVIVIGRGEAGERVAALARTQGKPVVAARLEPAEAAARRLAGAKVVALSGIGRPEKFAATLRETGASLVAEQVHGDHHAYGLADIAAVLATARGHGALIATTEKDWTKLAPLWPEEALGSLVVVPVTLAFAEPAAIADLLATVTPGRRA